MAEIKQGILGPVNGKVGTVVGATWRGVNYIRAKPRKSSKKPTMKQLLQWDKMSLVSTFASKFKDFVNANCPPVVKGKKWIAGKEQMISRLMTQGISLINGEQHIKVEEALLSIGNLAPAIIKKINRLKTGKFKVQWENGLVNALTLNTDKLTMMLYNETLEQFIAIPNVGNRIDKYAHFSIPVDWDKGNVYFWSMWKATDATVHSTSCFHGIIELENIIEQESENRTQRREDENQESENTMPHNLHQVETQSANTPPVPFTKNIYKTFFLRSVLCHTKQENSDQKTEKEDQEISEVIPIEQARDTALKQYLKEVDTSTKENTTPAVKQHNKEGEVKKWTPPGYIRKVNKEIIKQPKTKEDEEQTDILYEKLSNEPRSILEFNAITEEQKE